MGENHIPGFYSVGLITLLQGIPVYFIMVILRELSYATFKQDRTTGVIFILILLAANSLFFLPKERHEKVLHNIERLDKKKRQVVRTSAILYTMTALILIVLGLIF